MHRAYSITVKPFETFRSPEHFRENFPIFA
jgi:hypothetical protein